MVEVDFKIVICGLICLTVILLSLIFLGKDSETISTLIVGIIALAIGVIIPSPTIDNNKGVLKW